jgi:hypothetical protein
VHDAIQIPRLSVKFTGAQGRRKEAQHSIALAQVQEQLEEHHYARFYKAAMDAKYSVEVAPAQAATESNPFSYGPTYRYSGSKEGFPTLPGVTNLYENFR